MHISLHTKTIALAFILVIAFLFTGCGKEKEADTPKVYRADFVSFGDEMNVLENTLTLADSKVWFATYEDGVEKICRFNPDQENTRTLVEYEDSKDKSSFERVSCIEALEDGFFKVISWSGATEPPFLLAL